MQIKAICIRCGEHKQAAFDVCSRCGLDPSLNEEDMIKSAYLSLGRFNRDEQRDYEGELLLMGRALRDGYEVIKYDSKELDRLRAQKHLVESVPSSAAWGALFRFFLPSIGLLIFLWVLLSVVRR